MGLDLYRLQEGQVNWGSSVNTNWCLIEKNAEDLQNEINELSLTLNTLDFGAVFGGFLYGSEEKDENKHSQKVIVKKSVGSDGSDADAEFWVATDAAGNTTLPVNAIFCIPEEIKHTMTAKPKSDSNKYFYSNDWLANSFVFHSRNTYQLVYWNGLIYMPESELNESGQMVFKLKDQPTGKTGETGEEENTEICISFPAGSVNCSCILLNLQQAEHDKDTGYYWYGVSNIFSTNGGQNQNLNLSPMVQFATMTWKDTVVESFKPFYVDYALCIQADNTYRLAVDESIGTYSDFDSCYALIYYMKHTA